jgi:Xaa-Pro aminopeptidase
VTEAAREAHQRDLVGTGIVDYERRVDIDRLKRERLARVREQMAAHDLAGMLLTDQLNLRYATGTRDTGVYGLRFYHRYAVIAQSGKIILFGSAFEAPEADELIEPRAAQTWDYFPAGSHVQDAAKRWAAGVAQACRDLGIAGDRLGIDRLDITALEALRAENVAELADARVPFEKARVIKTQDEVTLMRQACAVADIGICAVRDAIEPGVTENDLWAIFCATNIRLGGEHVDARLLTAGGNTNPWYQPASDRLVRYGEFVAFDTDMAGPMGYFADISRTYLCGDGPGTEVQREQYRFAYDFLQQAIPLFRPGVAFREIAEKVPVFPERWKQNRYVVLAHGCGMSDEWPAIYFPDVSWSGFGNDDAVLEENMVISVEALVGEVNRGESVKLEDQILITADGNENLTLAPFDWRFLD